MLYLSQQKLFQGLEEGAVTVPVQARDRPVPVLIRAVPAGVHPRAPGEALRADPAPTFRTARPIRVPAQQQVPHQPRADLTGYTAS